MAQSQGGDQAAYHSLLGQCRLILYTKLRPRLSDESQLEDVIQEILISIHKARHTFVPERAFKPWLFGIANFRLKDHFRSHYRKLRLEQAYVEDCDLNFQDQSVTFWQAKSEELEEAIRQLPQKQRNLVELMKIKGFTAVEVADQTGMTVTAVKVSVHRSLKRLKLDLKEQD